MNSRNTKSVAFRLTIFSVALNPYRIRAIDHGKPISANGEIGQKYILEVFLH